MKAAVEYSDHISIDGQTTRATLNGEQSLEIGRTVVRAVPAVELVCRQLFRTFCRAQRPAESIRTAAAIGA